MADLDRRYAQGTTVGRTEAGVVDQGLRAYMLRVYNYMASGVAITGVVAYLIYAMSVEQTAGGLQLTAFGSFIFASAFKWVVIFAPLALVFFISARINSMSLGTAQLTFWAFAALMGASISSIFLVYAGESIARVFFITAASFGALSLWGYTTKKDLSGWGSFLFMGLIGIIIASLVNLFVGLDRSAICGLGDRRAGIRRADCLRHAADQGDVQRQRRRHGLRPQGGDGSAQALSRLHQPVHDAAVAVRQPPLKATVQTTGAIRPRLRPGPFACQASTRRKPRSSARNTRARSWPRFKISPVAAITL